MITVTDVNRQSALLDGATLSWLEAGTGEALVLLHGIGSAAASWQAQLEAFGERYRVIAWDAPGYGGSAPLPGESPSAGDYAARLRVLLEHLDIARPVLVGHSLGALMAAAYLRRWPAAPGAVFANPALGYASAEPAERKRRLADRIALFESLGPRGLAEARGPKLLSPDAPRSAVETVCGIMAGVRAEGYLPAARMLAHGDLLRDVAGLAVPTLVVCGERDSVTPPAAAKRLAAAIDGAVYRDVPGAGHASYVEKPREFNALLDEFLASVAG